MALPVLRHGLQFIARRRLLLFIIGFAGCLLLKFSGSMYPSSRSNLFKGTAQHLKDTIKYLREEENPSDIRVFTQPVIPQNVNTFLPDLRDKYKSYLRPMNTFPLNASPRALLSPKNRTLIEDIIRIGYGQQVYKTESGEDAWIENGVHFRPWKKLASVPVQLDSPQKVDYEPYIPFDEELFFEGRMPDLRYKTEKKIILWHTPTRYTALHDDLKPMRFCPDFPCQMATNVHRYFDKSSAVLFAAQIIKSHPPARASLDQMFVFHNHEPQNNIFWSNKFRRPEWKSQFNWTFGYRMDADFVMPYAILRKRPAAPPVAKDYQSILAQKTHSVAWMVSNCRTTAAREKYVAELQKHIRVDVYGDCGPFKCNRGSDADCADDIGKKYKFYLSFESAICSDYVTEKLFRYLARDIVIVARGGDEYYRHLPSETFVNANNFPSPKLLADELLRLENDHEAYISILREKNKYTAIFEDYPLRNRDGSIRYMVYLFSASPMCLMCQRLWNLQSHAKSYRDIGQWFGRKMCRLPRDLPRPSYNATRRKRFIVRQ